MAGIVIVYSNSMVVIERNQMRNLVLRMDRNFLFMWG